MISAEIINNEIQVTFKYVHNSEYCKIIIGKLGQIGAKWNPIAKIWVLPASKKSEFNAKLKEYLVVWKGEEQVTGGGIKESEIDDEPIVPGYSVTYDDNGCVVGSKGFKVPPIAEYQVRGFNAIVARNFLILADEMGLGKVR